MKNKKHLIWGVIMLACLTVAYILARFVFFGLHGMGNWPNVLVWPGVVIIVAGAFLKLRWTSLGAAFGYVAGFIAGALFNTDGVDPGGGVTNNFWIIWTMVFIACILIGVVADVITKVMDRIRRA